LFSPTPPLLVHRVGSQHQYRSNFVLQGSGRVLSVVLTSYWSDTNKIRRVISARPWHTITGEAWIQILWRPTMYVTVACLVAFLLTNSSVVTLKYGHTYVEISHHHNAASLGLYQNLRRQPPSWKAPDKYQTSPRGNWSPTLTLNM